MWFITEPPKNPLIELVKEPIVIQEVVALEPTVEEKIKANYYNCNEAVEWIRADTAECLPKSVVTARTTENPSQPIKNASQATSGWYTYGYCTEWVASQRPVGQWGDAGAWKSQALADGWTVSSTPIVGAIAWQPGHVAYVESVGDGVVTVSEKNYKGWNIISTRTVPISTFSYIY